MSRQSIVRALGAALVASTLWPLPALAATLTLNPDRDNTLFEDTTGSLSNGAGGFLFSGTTADNRRRRAVLHFDLSAVPPGATITGATLRLVLSQATSGSQTMEVHRLLASWGEGTSNSGGTATSGGGQGAPSTTNDATWIHRFFPAQLWTSAGSDLAAAPSASQVVGLEGTYDWTGGSLAADVQGWSTNPASNFGWVLVGGEAQPQSAKRFNSRENLDNATRPQLIVTYTTTAAAVRVPALAGWSLAALAGLLTTVMVISGRSRARPSRPS